MELMDLPISIKDSWENEMKKGDKSTLEIRVDNDVLYEKLVKKYWSKKYIAYKKVMPEILNHFGVKQQKVSWNGRYGCSCGCSPAFILEKHKGKSFTVIIG